MKTLVLSLCLGMCATAVFAQDPVFGADGFQPRRDYLSYSDTETVDTLSGDLLLRYIDLELPGNAGRALRFGRSRRGINGHWWGGLIDMPMRVTLASSIYVVMGDGSARLAGYATPYEPTNCSPCRFRRTRDYWVFDRLYRVLYMPDGSRYFFDEEGLFVRSYDPFGNLVEVSRNTGTKTVTVRQYLSPTEVRAVVLTFEDSEFTYLRRISYAGRQWVYQGAGDRLEKVISPAGTAWEYTDDGATFAVGTPQGGTIQYVYDFHAFVRDRVGVENCTEYFGDPNRCGVEKLAVKTRSVEGQVWHYDYAVEGGDVDRTTVTSPSGIVTEYRYTTYPGHEDMILESRVVKDGSTEEEREERSYVVIDGPELSHQVLHRDGLTFITDLEYDANHPFHDFARPWKITEQGNGLTRVTQRTFAAGFLSLGSTTSFIEEPLFVPKVASETVTVNGQPVTRSWTYDVSTGFTTSETAYGIQTAFEADGLGNVAMVRKANGTETHYEYSYGVARRIETDAHETTRAINADGTVASETAGGYTTQFDYDGIGRVRLVSPAGTTPIQTTYTDRDITVSRGNMWHRTKFDTLGRVIGTEDSAGVRTRVGYDLDGRTAFQSPPSYEAVPSIDTSFEYDALGRVVLQRNPDNTEAHITYGAGVVMTVDEKGRQSFRHFQGGGPAGTRLTGVTDAKGNTWQYEYNALGALTKVTAPGNVLREWHYNTARPELLDSETQPESGTVTYDQYDAAGNLRQKHDARGTAFQYDYDGNDRLYRVTATNGGTTRVIEITFEPGSDRRRTARVVNGVTTTYTYDAAGRLATRRDEVPGQQPRTEGFTYNDKDQLARLVYGSGRTIDYTYDAGGRVASVRDASLDLPQGYVADYAADFEYHPTGAVTSYHTGNGLEHEVEYHPTRYWPTRIRAGTLFDLVYANYDNVGNVGAIVNQHAGTQETFEYDTLDRLTRAVGPYGDARYAYDAHGNRLSNGVASYSYENTFRLVQQNDRTFSYDANGNLKTATAPGAAYNYTLDNQLETSTADGITAAYEYDADGWRVAKTVDGVTSIFLRGPGGELLSEIRPANNRDYIYAAGKLIAMVHRRKSGEPAVNHVVASLPDPGTGLVHFDFAASSPLQVFLDHADLRRAPQSGTCSPGNPSGCVWTDVDTEPAPAHTVTWSNSTALSDVPTPGQTFVYTVRVTDTESNAGSGPLVAVSVVDDTPEPFTFTDQTGAAVGTAVASNIVPITGILGQVTTTLAGGGGSYRVCTNATCSTNPAFTSAPGTIANNQYVQLRLTSSAQFSTAVSTTFAVGTVSDNWSVSTVAQDTTPDIFTFTDQTNVMTGSAVTSNVLPITGITGLVLTSITGGTYRICADAGCAASPAFISGASSLAAGQYVQLRTTASSAVSTTTNVVMTVGTVSDTWSVTTSSQDSTPAAFTFTDLTNLYPNALTSSNYVQVTGITGNVPISASGPGAPQYRICTSASSSSCGSWTSGASTISNSKYLIVRATTAPDPQTAQAQTVTVGSYSTAWTLATGTDPCAATSPTPGVQCYDGSKYAGRTPDGNVKMYAAAADLPNKQFAWPQTYHGVGNSTTGEANTNALAQYGNYHAANACYNLVVHGKDDWYLPAPLEWNAMDPYRNAIGGFAEDDETYWTSKQDDDPIRGIYHKLGSTFTGYTGEGISMHVRCVRKD